MVNGQMIAVGSPAAMLTDRDAVTGNAVGDVAEAFEARGYTAVIVTADGAESVNHRPHELTVVPLPG